MIHARSWGVLILAMFMQTAHPAIAQTPATEITTGTNIPLAAGATLELRAVNGEASFLKAPGDQVVVEFARAVPADVKIVTLTTPQGVTVCTIYASYDPKKPTECLPDGKGRLAAGKIKDQSRVQFRIRVPSGVHVKATIDQGDLKCIGITGNVQFYSNNGYVLVHDAGTGNHRRRYGTARRRRCGDREGTERARASTRAASHDWQWAGARGDPDDGGRGLQRQHAADRGDRSGISR